METCLLLLIRQQALGTVKLQIFPQITDTEFREPIIIFYEASIKYNPCF